MSFSDSPREPRAPRKARPRLSLKMQAIGFLSRREHSRQELRTKLLDSLRKRAREEAALEAASEKAARDLADALSTQPSNGIDDAFAPPMPAEATAPRRAGGGRSSAARPSAGPLASGEPPALRARVSARDAAPARGALQTLSLANGAPLPARLRASLAAADTSAHEPALSSADAAAVPANAPDDDQEHSDPEAAVDQLLDWLAANNYLSETRFVESRVNARSRKQGALRIKLELSRHGLALEPEQAAALRETEFARAQALWQRKFGVLASDARERAKQARFLASRGFAADVVRRVVGGQDEY